MAGETSNTDNYGTARERYERFAKRLRDDAGLRARVEAGDTGEALRALGLEAPPGVEMRVAVNTPEVFHVAFPPDPNTDMTDDDLTSVVGGTSPWRLVPIGTFASHNSCSMEPVDPRAPSPFD